ncbi:MAG: polymerase sigma factor RpoE [Candidatus Saccharibacteria bacterium]|nr:polymerase sigma factor RpoE [Candidatus Saccharibacteria bacterium]
MTPDEPTIALTGAALSAQERRHDTELLVRFREEQDAGAFEELYIRYMPGIYGKHLGSTGDPDLAEDLAQETFMRAITGAFDGQSATSNVNAWLYRVAGNQDIDLARRRSRVRVSQLDETKPSHQQVLVEEERAFELIDSRDNYARILEAIPKQFLSTFVALYIEQRTIAEVAAIENVSELTVRTRVHRARKAAMKCLEGYVADSEHSDDELAELLAIYLAKRTSSVA